ncbi:MAG TPA: hypothetical protein VF707_09085 [Ardenticatenaceae bacterium]|jgi:hypothetical protein
MRANEEQKLLSIEELREETKRRAALLQDVPRDELLERSRELRLAMIEEAIANGVALEEDWCDDEEGDTGSH